MSARVKCVCRCDDVASFSATRVQGQVMCSDLGQCMWVDHNEAPQSLTAPVLSTQSKRHWQAGLATPFLSVCLSPTPTIQPSNINA
mmetsp:Transcript_14905/g.35548  ORF Transcript_14905/g.35548 Transcript_14905/m.35548 type:complete len:86 (+) Transcript_14905:2053-2310(+)